MVSQRSPNRDARRRTRARTAPRRAGRHAAQIAILAADRRRHGAEQQRRQPEHQRQEQRGHELRHEAEHEVQPDRDGMRAARDAGLRPGPSEEVDRRRRSRTGTAAPPCCCCAGRARRAAASGRTARDARPRRRPGRPGARRSRRRRGTRAPPNSASQNRMPNSSCGSRPRRIGAATIQNLSGGFSRKASSSCGLLLGVEPVADLEDAIDREGVDGFVVLEISAAETDEQRQAEEREHESQPGPAHGSFLDASDERPDPRNVHFLDRHRLEARPGRGTPGRSRSDLKPMCTVNGEIARSIDGQQRVRAAEVVEDDDAAARAADAPHLAGHGDRIGHDADEIRRVDDVEGVVGELERRRRPSRAGGRCGCPCARRARAPSRASSRTDRCR